MLSNFSGTKGEMVTFPIRFLKFSLRRIFSTSLSFSAEFPTLRILISRSCTKGKRLQARTCCNDVQQRHLFVKVAQEPYCLWFILYFVDEQQCALRTVGCYFALHTQKLEYAVHVIALSENVGIGLLFQIKLYVNIKLLAKFVNQSGRANLSCTAQHKWFAIAALAPLFQICRQLSVYHDKSVL